jgi:hypothetical protein
MKSKRHEVKTVCGHFNLDETEYHRYTEACRKAESIKEKKIIKT